MFTRKDIEDFDKLIGRLQLERTRRIELMQKECKHPEKEVIEANWKECFYVNSFPPFRVCRLCGYAEEGWGCGFWKLNYNDVPEMDRDKVFKYVLKLLSQEDLSKIRFKEKQNA